MLVASNNRAGRDEGRKNGRIKGSDGVYEGEIMKGKPHGKGTYKYADGRVYEGEYKSNKKHGKGTYTWANGNEYTGEWVNDNEHGKGTSKWSDGDVYTGEYENGNMHGKGTYKWSDGNVYEGEYKSNKKHGKGTLTWANGNEYTGEWVNNNKNGKGTFKWSDGDVYTGEYENGNMHGKGTYKWSDGNVYEGGWKNDKRDGNGTFKDSSDGSVYEGNYKNDKKHGKGTLLWPDGHVYEGGWESNKKHGHGTFKWPDGRVYEGGLKNGKKDGKGRDTRPDGEIYIGDYEDGHRHGTGKLKEAASDVYSEVVYSRGNLVRRYCKRMSPIEIGPPAKRSKLPDAAISGCSCAHTEIPDLEIERDLVVESNEPEHIVKSAVVDSSATCKDITAAELIDEPVATTTKDTKETANDSKVVRSTTHETEAGEDEAEERKVQDEGLSNPIVQAELLVFNNNASNIAPSETEKDDVKDGKAEEEPPAQSLEEPDTQEDNSVNEREVKFDYKDICKKLTVKVETQKAKMEGMKAEIKSLKKKLARRYNTEMY